MNITTIRLKKETKKKLRKFQIHPRETDEEIILRVLESLKKEGVIQPVEEKIEVENAK